MRNIADGGLSALGKTIMGEVLQVKLVAQNDSENKSIFKKSRWQEKVVHVTP